MMISSLNILVVKQMGKNKIENWTGGRGGK